MPPHPAGDLAHHPSIPLSFHSAGGLHRSWLASLQGLTVVGKPKVRMMQEPYLIFEEDRLMARGPVLDYGRINHVLRRAVRARRAKIIPNDECVRGSETICFRMATALQSSAIYLRHIRLEDAQHFFACHAQLDFRRNGLAIRLGQTWDGNRLAYCRLGRLRTGVLNPLMRSPTRTGASEKQHAKENFKCGFYRMLVRFHQFPHWFCVCL